MSNTTATQTIIIPCDDNCMMSPSDICECACEGVNHGQYNKLTAVQRTVVRTKAGRRIATVQPGTQAYKDAQLVLKLRDVEGYTQREIAGMMGWSAPTVRRVIRSLTVTETVVAAQEAELVAA